MQNSCVVILSTRHCIGTQAELSQESHRQVAFFCLLMSDEGMFLRFHHGFSPIARLKFSKDVL